MKEDNKEHSGEALKEVWLFTYSPDGLQVPEHIFAEMDEQSIDIIADEIASNYNGFHSVIAEKVKSIITSELAKGETEIRIDDEVDEMTEYIIIKTELDTGDDWYNCSYDVVVPEKTVDVFKGSTIYVTEGYYGAAESLYSVKPDKEFYEMTVE